METWHVDRFAQRCGAVVAYTCLHYLPPSPPPLTQTRARPTSYITNSMNSMNSTKSMNSMSGINSMNSTSSVLSENIEEKKNEARIPRVR